MTRDFPLFLQQWQLPAVVVLLVAYSFQELLFDWEPRIPLLLVVAIFLFLGTYLVMVIRGRKRGVTDTTLLFIWTGLASLFLAPLIWLMAENPVLLGGVLLAGVCLTMPIGIVYKVVPFLCWFHLQSMLLRQKNSNTDCP